MRCAARGGETLWLLRPPLLTFDPGCTLAASGAGNTAGGSRAGWAPGDAGLCCMLRRVEVIGWQRESVRGMRRCLGEFVIVTGCTVTRMPCGRLCQGVRGQSLPYQGVAAAGKGRGLLPGPVRQLPVHLRLTHAWNPNI